VTRTGATGIMVVRVWTLLLATVRGAYWRQGLARYVLEKGLYEVRTGDRVWRGMYWRQGLARYEADAILKVSCLTR
jgi:hypothetical protein